jgi:predicted glycosyltransferase
MRYVADARSWYVAGTYRVTKRLELGAYYSHFLIHARVDAAPIADQYQYDTAISGKVNLTGHWYVKAEGHFMDGAPTSPSAARGFYAFSNPSGTLPNTRLLVIRTGFSF